MRVSRHAVERYQERIEAVTKAEARSRIRSAAVAVHQAAAFGATVVRMGDGTKLILEGTCVVTVLPRGWINGGKCERLSGWAQ
jgi:hypothetical protein